MPISGHEVPILSDEDVRTDFGTGLMMVCTFGDGADVQRWKRDGLDLRLGIDPAGKLTDVAGAYAGLDVDTARKQIVADLEAAGALRGSQKIEQQVSVSERTQRPVEFQMRPHWFVRVLDLTDELLARSGELDWHPEYMKVRLDRWIEGLKYDWNITRQRFYGVPFPVWFCGECGEPVLATEDQLPVDPLESPPPVDACPKCGSTEFTGDPDVMDTWMTSSMTPQVNANWARSPGRVAAAPLPMTLRVQAFEIIRTWLFYSLTKAHLHNDMLPWEHVMISGWGLNENGKKFSKRDLEAKQPGVYNKYDPEDVIDKYGADSLRFWAAGSHLGHDLRYHEEDVKTGRKLVLKLWNITRLVEQYAPDFAPEHTVPLAERTAEDRWIVSRLQRLLPAVERGFEMYDYAIAREVLDEFFWTEFCDDYVELIKDRFWTEDSYTEEQRASARSTLWETLRTLLGLYAPFLPFITEELYQYMYAQPRGRAVDPRDPLAGSPRRAARRGARDRTGTRRAARGALRADPHGRLPGPAVARARRRRRRRGDTRATLEGMTQSLLGRGARPRHPFRHRHDGNRDPGRPHRHRARAQTCVSSPTEGVGEVTQNAEGKTLDFNDSPEEAAWRTEFRAWLDEHAPTVAGATADLMGEGGGADYLDRARVWQRMKFEAGLTKIPWEPEFGGRNGTQHAAGRLQPRRVEVPRAARCVRDRPRDDRSHIEGVRHRRAARALPHQAAPRRGDLVPAVQRTRCRLRRRVACDHGGARRRRVGAQRPEGVDVRRAVLRLRRDHLSHQP